MNTNELIKFLIETEYINYGDDYKVIDKIVAKLKHYDILMKDYKESTRDPIDE